jgi:EAL domain-containing protein (putative c-di-GMP-specific phosphodiesterase class I)/CHASE2 domain-containing sensor protein
MGAVTLRAITPEKAWWLAPTLAALAGLLALASGWGGGIERSLREARDGLRAHPASGNIAIVEIDARSLRDISQWPWPRRYHAQLIDRLSAAGADLIAFDVSFAVRSNAEDDAALAAALERSGGLVALPTFREYEDASSLEEIEAIPYEPFRDKAFLAGVLVDADPDGLVRRLPLGTFIAGSPRPSMAALLAEAPGGIDEMLEIDYSIDPASIPRLSFIDIVEGRFDPREVAGKKLFVGGTAADMEDRYAVPIHGVLPGVVVQTLAAETLLGGGVPGAGSGFWLLLLALLAAVTAAIPGKAWRSVLALAVGSAGILALPLASEQWLGMTLPVFPALAALAVATLVALVLHVAQRYHARSLIDADTGLPNLGSFLPLIRSSGRVVVARIDRFEALAATLGPAGTATLVQRIAERISAESGQRVYRTDEHSLGWCTSLTAPDELEEAMRRITAAMHTPIECGRLVDVTLGLGIADPSGGQPGKQLVANAALAADRALSGRRPFLHFTEAQDEENGWHLSLMSELSAAMAAGEVWNAYQPKLDIGTGRVTGVETLVRWTHPERGAVGPDRFIPVVESSGRAAELTAHVFRAALTDAARWHAAGHPLTVAVNVSATLLEDKAFIAWLAETLRVSPVAAEMVTVEVTESAAVKNVEDAAAALAKWRALGVAISIDDYGTGQSSLGYLQRLPANELKIDMSFIRNITKDHRDAIMVRSTIALAHQLGMKVVAEGVEDQATLDLLKELECDVAQGWLVGRPVPADALEASLGEARRLAA